MYVLYIPAPVTDTPGGYTRVSEETTPVGAPGKQESNATGSIAAIAATVVAVIFIIITVVSVILLGACPLKCFMIPPQITRYLQNLVTDASCRICTL